jgi:NAD(P)-dependent dehydrogenase (short-subunit alcohol dehydrogenase family)
MSIEGQKVVVVGGTAGIGLAVAQAAALQGASIVVASRSQKRCEQAASKIEGDVEAYTVDVTNEDSIQALFDKVGEFDHLVTTPGDPITFGSFLDADMALVTRQFAVKFWGQYLCAKYGVRGIKPRVISF